MKTVYVILAFHAHEPAWDLPQQVLATVEDIDLKLTLASENWLIRRSAEGRDIYRELVGFARRMGVPLTLESSNELLVQLARLLPDTLGELKKAYHEGLIYPLYGHAHHTHVALLTEEEIGDEIRLNREYLHQVMGVPRPRYAGLFPTEGSLDRDKLPALQKAGLDYVIFPNLDRRRDSYRVEGGNPHIPYQPFLIGEGLVALPRHYPVSQYIWRPITRWKHEGVRNQGYLLGHYWVLPEEYRRKRFVPFPISREEAIREYQRVLAKALGDAPDGGLILYIQDLELMDFGDAALEIMEAAWQAVVKKQKLARVRFVTPDRYLEELVMPHRSRLAHLKFHQVSWAPELRLVLRYDGHYPPLGAGKFRGVDLTREAFRRYPFIFWEPGRYLASLCHWLTGFFGYSLKVPLSAGELGERGYHLEDLSLEARIALHSRIIKRACNWGWFPNESLQKRPFLHAYCLADLLLGQADAAAPGRQEKLKPPSEAWFRGLERLLEVVLDTRHGYLSQALVRLSLKSGGDYSEARQALEHSREWRDRAQRSILTALEHSQQLSPGPAASLESVKGMLAGLRDYCRCVFMSLDYLQRTWVRAGDTQSVLTTMYEYLYDLYPPRFPAILQSTLGQESEEGQRGL